MILLETYVEGLREGDAAKVGSVFSDAALFHDDAPCTVGLDPIILRGRAAIVDNFAKLLVHGGLTIDNVAFNDNAMRYDIVMSPELSICCLGVYKEEDGKIVEYFVTSIS